MTALIVNFYAGPGAAKSTLTAATFAALKWLGIECEMALEYAKDKVWEESTALLNNQLYVFGKQQHRIYRLSNKVDVIITDAPLLNSVYYDAKNDPIFRSMIKQEYEKHDNLDFLVHRTKPYNPKGRLQTESEAISIDSEIKRILDVYTNGKYISIPGEPAQVEKTIVPNILSMLELRKGF